MSPVGYLPIPTISRLNRIEWWCESDAEKHWTWHRGRRVAVAMDECLAHAPFLPQVTRFLETLPYMHAGNRPVFVPIWALQLPMELPMDQFHDGDLMIDHLDLKKLLRNPAGVKDLPPLDAFLKRVDGTWTLYCPNRERLLVLRCVQAVHVNVVLKVRCQVRRWLGEPSTQLAWPASVAFFLGKWVDDHGKRVRVQWKGNQSGSVVAQIRRCRHNLNIDKEGRWTCGEGVLQPHQSSHNIIVWLSDENAPRQWTWQRSADSDEYMPCAPFMPEVTRFCHEDVPRMTPSNEPVQPVLVPVWAMRFTQYNINENLRFSNGRSMFVLLKQLLIDPAAVSNLEPLDVFLYQGPDGKQALYCINNRRLLVLRCLQAVRSEMLIKVKCCVHDIHSTARVPHGTGTGRFCDWFKSGYSKPGQFAGCDGLGLCIWVRDRRWEKLGKQSWLGVLCWSEICGVKGFLTQGVLMWWEPQTIALIVVHGV